jgi:hypothetical protein
VTHVARILVPLVIALSLVGFTPLHATAWGGSKVKYFMCARDSKDKIKRVPNTVSQFKRTRPKPPGCAQCQVDHIVSLRKG